MNSELATEVALVLKYLLYFALQGLQNHPPHLGRPLPAVQLLSGVPRRSAEQPWCVPPALCAASLSSVFPEGLGRPSGRHV